MSNLLEPAEVALDVCSLSLQWHHIALEAPAEVGVEVGGGVGAALSFAAGQVCSDGQPQHGVIGGLQEG